MLICKEIFNTTLHILMGIFITKTINTPLQLNEAVVQLYSFTLVQNSALHVYQYIHVHKRYGTVRCCTCLVLLTNLLHLFKNTLVISRFSCKRVIHCFVLLEFDKTSKNKEELLNRLGMIFTAFAGLHSYKTSPDDRKVEKGQRRVKTF